MPDLCRTQWKMPWDSTAFFFGRQRVRACNGAPPDEARIGTAHQAIEINFTDDAGVYLAVIERDWSTIDAGARLDSILKPVNHLGESSMDGSGGTGHDRSDSCKHD